MRPLSKRAKRAALAMGVFVFVTGGIITNNFVNGGGGGSSGGPCGLENGTVLCDATTTGPTGTLTSISFSSMPGGNTSGDIVTAGAVIQNVIITGSPGVLANNVTFKNCIINGTIWVGRAHGGQGGDTGVSGTHISNCRFIGNGSVQAGIEGVNGLNDTFDHNDISGYENCITSWGGGVRNETNVSILDNYCHGEASQSTAPHYDGFEIYGVAGGALIRGNTIVLTIQPSAAPINLTPTPSYSGTVTVDHNYAQSAKCGYVILGDTTKSTTAQINAVITNNELIKINTPECNNTSSYFALENTNAPTFPSTYTCTGNVGYEISGPHIFAPITGCSA